MQFGPSGIWEHPESTLTAIIGFAAALGLITAPQSAGLNSAVPVVVAAITAIASVVKLFYKGSS